MTASISGERAPLTEPTRRLMAAAQEIAPVLRRSADAAERDSRLTPEAERALREAGLFRLGVPKRWGGAELAPADSMEVTAEVALACPSSAWVVMVSYVAQQIAASFGEQGRQDLWGDGPDVPMCGVFGRTRSSSRTTGSGASPTSSRAGDCPRSRCTGFRRDP
ncbi:acyl-CoA dehydrogenase family protein [Streptomyces olivaceoviridis]